MLHNSKLNQRKNAIPEFRNSVLKTRLPNFGPQKADSFYWWKGAGQSKEVSVSRIEAAAKTSPALRLAHASATGSGAHRGPPRRDSQFCGAKVSEKGQVQVEVTDSASLSLPDLCSSLPKIQSGAVAALDSVVASFDFSLPPQALGLTILGPVVSQQPPSPAKTFQRAPGAGYKFQNGLISPLGGLKMGGFHVELQKQQGPSPPPKKNTWLRVPIFCLPAR